jgi:hypothetical protein
MSLEFANWTPVAFCEDKGVGWADLSDQRFDRSFFFQNVDDWTKRGGEIRWTDAAALERLDALPSREPDLIIAHASRCGSTLLARMMAAVPRAILVSEPTLVTDIMTHGLAHPEAPTGAMLRQAVRALGRIRFGDETSYVLKLSSGATRFLPALRRASPHARIVWLQRRPEEIFMSELRYPSHWVGREGPEPLETRAFRKIALGFMAATAHVTDDMLVLDYLDLPDAAWTHVARFLGLSPSQAEIAAMRHITRNHAKSGAQWEPRQDPDLPPELAAHVEREIVPLYLQLDRRRPRSNA